jgi:hypothetical protein
MQPKFAVDQDSWDPISDFGLKKTAQHSQTDRFSSGPETPTDAETTSGFLQILKIEGFSNQGFYSASRKSASEFANFSAKAKCYFAGLLASIHL